MKVEIKEIKLEPIKPQLDFIIKDKFDPVLKPNTDLIVPSSSEELAIEKAKAEAKKTEESTEQKTDEAKDAKDKSFAPLETNILAIPEPKPKPKPKWFDECPVVIMATPRDLRTRAPVRRGRPEPVPKVTYASESEDSDSSDEESTSSNSSGGSDEYETNIVFEAANANKWKSTSSNDSGFDSSAPGSPANIRNRPDGSTNASTSGSESSSTLAPAHNPAFTLEPMEASSAYTAYQRSGRVTPPATSIPRFRKYTVEDFSFLKVLGKGSFGKVLLAELKNTEYYYAVKCLKKDIVLEDDDVECTLIERKVLALGTKHPYLCHLFCTFQTESHLFFVMEYLNGGDLMFHIQVSGRFPEPRGRFYGAEIVSGLKFLHSKGIVYRDLKLDNILLDFDGHVRIADFGMCKLQIFLDRTADTFCGTPDYMAPEIIKGQHYNQGVDWWSFGVLLYEMLIGQSPFSGCDEDELFWSICNERPVIPAFLSKEASQILTLLLEKDCSKRLGNRYCPAGDIKEQPFFHQIDWDKLERRQLEAPFKPKVQHPLDTQYFDKAFTTERVKLTPIEKDILHSMDQTQFHGFSYTNPNATDK
ncbi:Protein kinase C delta [Carabus blaptoides fortunei]